MSGYCGVVFNLTSTGTGSFDEAGQILTHMKPRRAPTRKTPRRALNGLSFDPFMNGMRRRDGPVPMLPIICTACGWCERTITTKSCLDWLHLPPNAKATLSGGLCFNLTQPLGMRERGRIYIAGVLHATWSFMKLTLARAAPGASQLMPWSCTAYVAGLAAAFFTMNE